MEDIILYWNGVALEANRVSHTNKKGEQTGPTLSSRALAIVHLAMYDAFIGTTPGTGYGPYLPGLPPAPAGATAQAAVSAAAHATLWALFPSQRPFFDAKLADIDSILNPGHAFGLMVAKKILANRSADPGAKDDGYVPSQERGRHKVDPDNPSQGFYSPYYGIQSNGFAITARHQLDPPPFDNPEYVQSLRQVRHKGIAPDLMGTIPAAQRRTNDETVIGLFWAYDGATGLGTPPRFYNQIVRRLAIARNNTTAQNARLFALVNVAMADAGILGWAEKYRYDLWRPVVGIREHDRSMGMAAEAHNDLNNDCDCSWLPMGGPATNSVNPQYDQPSAPSLTLTYQQSQIVRERPKNFTPNFPSYPSGHATFGAASLHITRLFYGELSVAPGAPNPMMGHRGNDTFFDGLDLVSEELNGVSQDNRGTVRPRHVRNFPGGLWKMIEENGFSRVYLGVHWLFDAFVTTANGQFDPNRNIGGVPLGLTIAEDIFESGMQPSPPAAAAPSPPGPALANHK